MNGGTAGALPGRRAGITPSRRLRLALLALVLVAVVSVSFEVGEYPVNPLTVAKILLAQVLPLARTWSPTAQTVVLDIRLPRLLAALLVGGALASSGATYQNVFRNPLVSPDILGVSAGASFGAALAITLGESLWAIEVIAFAGGVAAAAASFLIARAFAGRSPIVLVLGGVVIAAFFSALVSILVYIADPLTTLPEIEFFLLGGLSSVTNGQLAWAAAITIPAGLVLFLFRWPVNVLASGREEAQTLGVRQDRVWLVVVATATVMTAAVVCISGIIGWVGLLVPHMARMVMGSKYPDVLPASALLGAAFLLAVDTVARNVAYGGLPLGALTAIIGAPFFLLLLVRTFGGDG
ncbi:MAG TPA: iron ABC transporter permease [Trebonia sp.]